MKINEIALNENVWTDAAKYAGKTLPRIKPRPGESVVDAIKRVQAELGGVKSSDNLISADELAALRAQASTPPSSGPAVWSRRGDPNFNPTSSTGNTPSVRPAAPEPTGAAVPSDPAVWRRRAPSDPVVLPQQNPTNGPAAMNLQAAERMRQASAERRAAAPKPAETPAPKPAEAPADDLAKQIKPGDETTKTTGGRQEPGMDAKASDDGIKFTKAEILDMMKRQADRTPSINIGTDTAKKSSFPWKKTAAATAIAGPELYNLATPKNWSKFPDSVAHWPYNAANTVWQNFKDNTGVPTIQSVTPAADTAPPSTITPPVDQTTADNAIKNDPENKSVTQDIEQWNRDHPNSQIKEAYTSELNRIVFLSKP